MAWLQSKERKTKPIERYFPSMAWLQSKEKNNWKNLEIFSKYGVVAK